MKKLSRAIESKQFELQQREDQVEACDREVIELKHQIANFASELKHLKHIEHRYLQENRELQVKAEGENT